MGGKAEGFTMWLLEDTEKQAWPLWMDNMKVDSQIVKGLQETIEKRFMKGGSTGNHAKEIKRAETGIKGNRGLPSQVQKPMNSSEGVKGPCIRNFAAECKVGTD